MVYFRNLYHRSKQNSNFHHKLGLLNAHVSSVEAVIAPCNPRESRCIIVDNEFVIENTEATATRQRKEKRNVFIFLVDYSTVGVNRYW